MKASQLILLILFLCCGCKDGGTAPPPIPERVKLTLIDVAVREAYLHIAVSNPANNETLSLQRNGATVMTFAAVADTNIADTALTQTTAYQYTAALIAGSTTAGTSNTISAQTLTPTSHNFTWQTFLLGDGNNSVLYDVALINDTLAYAVGEIYMSGDPTRYNAAIWNGNAWSIERVPYYYQGQPFYNPIQTVFAFAHDDIWFAGNGVIHWNGQEYVPIDISSVWGPYRINKIWGSSANDLYIGGDGGNIAHCNGITWQSLESGTRTQINDAWGVVNPVTGKEEVYCPVSSFFTPSADKKILRITIPSQVDTIPWATGRNLFGIWSAKGFPLFTAGAGVFENSRGYWRETPLPSIYSNAVRANCVGDVIVAGDAGFVAHYDGAAWFVFRNVYDATYYSVSMKGDMLAIVGERNSRGVITIGRRE